MMFRFCNRVLVTMAVTMLAACASGGGASQVSSAPSAEATTPIPPGSSFAKIKIGMASDEVFATIGPPTSQQSYQTGKGWIPFHFGGDNSRTAAHYKGIGVITFSQNSAFTSSMSVLSIVYDPTDPGFERNK